MDKSAVIIGGVAILDANIVYPIRLTDFLLTAATEFQLLRPLISPAIVVEARRHILEDGHLDPAKIDARFRAVMAAAPGSAEVPDPLTDALALEIVNVKDHHVLAAALHHEADFILSNDKDFVREVNEWRRETTTDQPLWGALTANSFAKQLVHHEPQLVILTLRKMAAKYQNPPRTTGDVLEALSKEMPDLLSLNLKFET
jgi:PIN domain